MFEYEDELSSQLFRISGVSLQTYEVRQNIKKLYSYLENQTNSLTEACIQYQTKKYEEINNRYQKVQNYIYAGLLFIAIINYLYITKLIKNIASNLARFSKSAIKLAERDWYIEDISEQNCLELNIFARAFNTMKNNIQKYITQIELKSQIEKELYEQQLKNIEIDQLLKESQLLSLQSQMNPHFLFNTMNIISRTAMFDGNDTVVKLMESMSKILRYNLMNIRNMVTLQEEIDIVKAYLYIQTTRFQDQMEFDIQTEGVELEHIYIPPMIIQPIVENCIKHGFKNKEEGGRITIGVIQKEPNAVIIIEDNGQGILPEDLGEIFKERDKLSTEKSEVGLKNVKKRLELNFQTQDLLQIKSTYGYGTTVTITIPIGRERDD